MIRMFRCLAAAGALLSLGGCFQAQLFGPVSAARISVSELRDTGAVHAATVTDAPANLVQQHGQAQWEAFGEERRLWFLGVFKLDIDQVYDDRLYLVTASAGRETDLDGDGREDGEYTPVSGSWRAIMTGAQLKSKGPKVSPLTEAVYQWLAPALPALDDWQVMHNLDRAAMALVKDVDGNLRVTGADLVHWSRLFDQDKLLADAGTLDAVARSVLEGGEDDRRRALSRDLLGIAVDRESDPAKYLPGVLRNRLAGLAPEAFFQVSYRWLLQREPETIVGLGLHQRYGTGAIELNDISDQSEQLTYRLAEVILEELEAVGRAALPRAERVSYDVYQWYLQDMLEGEKFQLYSYPASAFITGVPRNTLFFFTDIHPLETADDARDYLARLQLVAPKFAQLRDKVAARAEFGVIEPEITLNWAIDGLKTVARTRASSTGYFRRLDRALDKLPGLEAGEGEQLRAATRAVIEDAIQPAYDALIADLETLLGRAPQAIGFGQFSGGDDFYRWALRHHTTTGMTPAQVHQLGRAELERVHTQIRAAARELGYRETLSMAELFEAIAEDSGVLVGGGILSAYEDLVERAAERLPEAFDLLPRQEVVVIGGPTGGFYVSGSEDGSRPGAFYAATTGQEPRYLMPSLAYHEAVPGHHLQIALAQEQALPDFRRYTTYTGFVEGWALYAERLAWELGWYDEDPYGNLGRLQFEAIRAARLVVDTGIHHYGWSWNRAVAFYRDATGESQYSSQGNVGRFLRWPGQATAYMIGMNRMLSLREKMADAEGDQFELRDFHRFVLSGAAMPLSILGKALTRELTR